MKYNYLSLSPFIPYDHVKHAGGKIYNYFIKELHKSDCFAVKILTTADKNERKNNDLKKYGIDYACKKLDYLQTIIRYLLSVFIYLNPSSKWGSYFKYPVFRNYFIYKLKQLKNRGYQPHIISLEWTQCAFLIHEIKKIFPAAFYVCFEHDVSFNRFARVVARARGLMRYIFSLQMSCLKQNELAALKRADLVLCLSKSEEKLLTDNGVQKEKTLVIAPYFHDYSSVNPAYASRKIVYYGFMRRKENYLSAIWFITYVFSKVLVKYPDAELLVIGAEPPAELRRLAGKNVRILGFVENVGACLEQACCMVAPLLMGGGIKIKILECMSAGLPVITNRIGIEGIPAVDNKDYIHAENIIDYEQAIDYIYTHEAEAGRMGRNAKAFIKKNFNVRDSFDRYKAHLGNIEDHIVKWH